MGAPYHPATNGEAERFIQTFKGKMKALNCDKSRMHAELCNILLSYRKTIHPATGKSPSMMLFNRQIRSRLDLMVPNAAVVEEKPEVAVRSLPEGARVAARDFLSKDKWKYGHVAEKLGKLHYNIKLDDGRLWKRHIDQLREVGANLPSGRPEIPAECFEPDIVPVAPRTNPVQHTPQAAAAVPTPIAEPQSSRSAAATPKPPEPPAVPKPKSQGPLAVPKLKPTNAAGRSEANNQQSPRRSTRVIKPPRRLDL